VGIDPMAEASELYVVARKLPEELEEMAAACWRGGRGGGKIVSFDR
jgi:hypothetical protein